MKICLIADAMSIHTQKWANYFATKGHEVHLISSSPGEGYTESIQLHQLTVPLPQKFWEVLRLINVLVRVFKARRLVKRIKPDIINTHFITTNGFLGATSGFHPHVLTAWGSDILLLQQQNLYWRSLGKYALKRADLVTCDSEVLKSGLVGLGVAPNSIKIIFHGIDTQKFKPQPDKGFRTGLGLQGASVVISTRSLMAIYNVEMLIRAIPLILKHTPQVSFIIAGDGEQKEYLEKLATSLGVSENVRFLGWIPPDELSSYLASADIYVSTSLSDSTSLSLQEAMACELAPVVTDLPANREWVTDGKTGFIVPVNDVSALVDRIIYLLENKKIGERFGKEGRKIIKKRAEYEKEMEKAEKLFEEMVRNWKSPGKKFRE
jgi:glycosyltransferase involved in cell wall biosynthesis